MNIANSATADPSEDYSGQAGVAIDVAAGATANVTLDDVNINMDGAAVEIEGNGDVVIELDGTNTVQSGGDHAGVEKNTIAAAEDDPGSGNATCTADGTKTRECIWCGLKDTVADPGSKLEHSFNSYISDGNATYEQDGTKTAKCDNCDETDTLPDPGSKLEKQEEPVTVSPKPAAAVEYTGVDEAAFWQEVARRIEAANPGDTIQVNAGGICTIPAWVIDAAVERGVTLFIHWLGGEDFLIDRQPDTGSQTFSVYSFSDLIQMLAK